MQGDVFSDVPFVKAKRASKVTDDPHAVAERRMVAVVGYPCDIYLNGALAKVQTVVPVVTADKAGISQDWDGAFTLAPLPDLRGDGVMYAADFRVFANIDAFYLNPHARIRCMSELGWAAFRQRLGLAGTRLLNHLTDLTAVGAEVWQEMALWQRWNETGRKPTEFGQWLDGRETNLGGFSRRSALSRGMHDVVRASLETELSD